MTYGKRLCPCLKPREDCDCGRMVEQGEGGHMMTREQLDKLGEAIRDATGHDPREPNPILDRLVVKPAPPGSTQSLLDQMGDTVKANLQALSDDSERGGEPTAMGVTPGGSLYFMGAVRPATAVMSVRHDPASFDTDASSPAPDGEAETRWWIESTAGRSSFSSAEDAARIYKRIVENSPNRGVQMGFGRDRIETVVESHNIDALAPWTTEAIRSLIRSAAEPFGATMDVYHERLRVMTKRIEELEARQAELAVQLAFNPPTEEPKDTLPPNALKHGTIKT